MREIGAFVVFEGHEGVGKSTQVALLRERLARGGVAHVLVREPGGTDLGDAIRELLLDPRRSIDASAEALLFMASRAQLVHDVIRPALESGQHVIADRFFLSTYAYQMAGRRLPSDEVRSANRLATSGVVPDLTLLLDLTAAEGLKRAAARSGPDRIERSGDGFYDRVEGAFDEFTTSAWQHDHPECGRIVRIDASGSREVVADRIDDAIARTLPQVLGVHTASGPMSGRGER